MVRSSITCTRRPAGSPFGEASQLPSAAEVASTQNGEDDSHATSRSVSSLRSLSRARAAGSPSRSARAAGSVISVHGMTRRYAGGVRVQTEIEAPWFAVRVARHRCDLVEQGHQPVVHPFPVIGPQPEAQARAVESTGGQALDLLEEGPQQEVASDDRVGFAVVEVPALPRGQVGPLPRAARSPPAGLLDQESGV